MSLTNMTTNWRTDQWRSITVNNHQAEKAVLPLEQ
jgi:hypothetical protein